jgi:hypothetical protein
MGRDWRLRTAASTGVYLSPDDLRCGPWMILQPPVLSGGPVSRNISVAARSTGWFPVGRDISGSYQYFLVSWHPRRLWSEWDVGKGNENLVYPSTWDKSSFIRFKILRHGTPALLPIRKEGMLRILLSLKIHFLGRARTRKLWVQRQT